MTVSLAIDLVFCAMAQEALIAHNADLLTFMKNLQRNAGLPSVLLITISLKILAHHVVNIAKNARDLRGVTAWSVLVTLSSIMEIV